MPRNSSLSPPKPQPRADRLDALRALLDKAARLQAARLRAAHAREVYQAARALAEEVRHLEADAWAMYKRADDENPRQLSIIDRMVLAACTPKVGE